MTKEAFTTYIERSQKDKTVMDTVLNRIPIKPGDVFLIPSRCVHAIGAGCLILEVQEPTDFTISPEYWCGDYPSRKNRCILAWTETLHLTALITR